MARKVKKFFQKQNSTIEISANLVSAFAFFRGSKFL